jgi:ABC-type antimicrobial peptide transport system permease subunit
MLPFNGMSTSTSNQVTFSEVEFSMRITLQVVVTAVVFAVAMGLIGGVAPAWGAARREILAALRD